MRSREQNGRLCGTPSAPTKADPGHRCDLQNVARAAANDLKADRTRGEIRT